MGSPSLANLDGVVREIASQKEAWSCLPIAEKLRLLYEIRDRIDSFAAEWASVCNQLRGIKKEMKYEEGTGYLTGPLVMGPINALIATYKSLAATGIPPEFPFRIHSTGKKEDDQKIVSVYPRSYLDRLAALGLRGEVWLEKSSSGTQGASLRDHGLCGILGAGNFEGPIDVLHKMFAENKVVVYKSNPVNEPSMHVVTKILEPLIDRKYLALVTGGSVEGSFLVNHPLVDEIMLTGSVNTYDSIVWGPPDIREKNNALNKRMTDKRVDAELGGVNPVIVVPGNWSNSDIDHHAEQIIAVKVFNSGHVCSSPSVIVVDAAWPQRSQFTQAIRKKWKETQPVPLYYPGIEERCARLKESLGGNVEHIGGGSANEDRCFVADAEEGSPLFTNESFGPFLTETALKSCNNDPSLFLKTAVDWCNTNLWGTLSCTLLVHPSTKAILGDELEDAIANLRYGSIGVNIWGGCVIGYPLGWGAFPNSNEKDIQSGNGCKIINGYLFDKIEKSVMHSPFRSPLHWSRPSNQTSALYRAMALFNIRPNLLRLLVVVRALGIGF